jgi:hypothetical protein
LRRELAAWRRNLALLEADRYGAAIQPISAVAHPEKRWSRFRQLYDGADDPTVLLHPGAGLHIVDLNDAFAKATDIDRRTSSGERLFDVFPENPADRYADGVSNMYRSLRTVAETGKSHAMAVQRYDISVDGVFIERYWRPINIPIFDQYGRLSYIAHRTHNVTAAVLARKRARD